MTPDRIIVAVDVDDLDQAHKLLDELRGTGVTIKFGNQLGTYIGWKKAIELGQLYDSAVFCDTKYKDIPKTIELSSRVMTRLQPAMFNIMADNTPEALTAATAGVESAIQDFKLDSKPLLLGVTVLTSFTDQDAIQVYGGPAIEKVQQFAAAAATAGLDGLVCSPHEIRQLKSSPETSHLVLVTPGIRPDWSDKGDQKRIMTPATAVSAGADYLVIGRPITNPPSSIGSPKNAVQKIMEEIN
ncbi:orotidine-5'-phosphate decarboxylase [Candidatus Saccharibacteria bacterium]|nr:orotidine-5'-phosphate decarboxylase [Candidatus Saccharibacteria bacterium]